MTDTTAARPSLADVLARARNSSATDPTWRVDYTTPGAAITEAEHRAAMGWDAVEAGAQFDRDNPVEA